MSGIWDNGNKQPIDIDRNLIDDVLDDVRREARCEMMERATTAQLRYLERLLANANTTWPMVKRRWLEAPARFDELDKQQAGALIAKLRRHGTFRRTTAWVAGHPDGKTLIDAARFRK